MKKYKDLYPMPKGYLDKFDAQWTKQLIAKEKKRKAKIKKRTWQIATAAAALLLIALFSTFYFTKPAASNGESTQSLLASLDQASLRAYLLDERIPEEELLEYANLKAIIQSQHIETDKVPEEVIEDWLEKENEWLEETYE